jgi:rhodanese-related sulfurtransferase
VLDVREPKECAHGHVPGAGNLPQADLASRLDELLRDRPLLTICRGGSRSLRAAQFLKQAGFGRAARVKGGTDTWCVAVNASPLPTPAASTSRASWKHHGIYMGPTLACLN